MPGSGPARSTRLVDQIADLGAVFEPGLDAVLLRREVAPGLRALTATLVRLPGLSGAAVLEELDGRADALAPLFRGAPAGVDPRALADDLAALAALVADLTGASAVGVRLARLAAPMCPRFHVDRVTLRCVVTYEGRGTEWLERDDVDRSRLGHRSGGLPDERSGLLAPGAVPCAAPPGAPLFLKGELWPGHEGRGVVHRSPHVAADSPRLVATLDPLD